MEILLVTLQTTDSATITQECYATILEVSLYSFEFWQAFWKHPQVLDIHRTLLLNNEQPTLRDAIKLKILSVCGGHLPSSCSLSTADIASQFWTIIDNILPETLHKAEQSAQLFDLAEHVFRTQDLHDRREESSRSLLHNWSSLLLAYNHTETPGRYKHDNVVLGFTKLMLCCVSSLKSFKLPLDASALISSIFQKFIFTLQFVSLTVALRGV
jgi:ubiquitin carboxyl-terminal hydrolase 34